MKGFIEFIKEQGVVGLAIGFILGGAISKLVASLVNDIINPLIGIALGSAKDLSALSINVGDAKIMVGNFITTGIDFLVIAFVVYVLAKMLKLDKIIKK
jgi:large conductance mechanosensitive channel